MPNVTRGAEREGALSNVRVGDVIEVRQKKGAHKYRGEVEVISPQQDILWMLHGALKERKLIDTSEYVVQKSRSPL